MRSPEELAQAQLDAYNAQDVDAFMSCYADDVTFAKLNGEVLTDGAAAVRERYVTLFAQYPQNRAVLLNRIVSGNVVIDEEEVYREPGQSFRACAIYSVRDGKIVRVDSAS